MKRYSFLLVLPALFACTTAIEKRKYNSKSVDQSISTLIEEEVLDSLGATVLRDYIEQSNSVDLSSRTYERLIEASQKHVKQLAQSPQAVAVRVLSKRHEPSKDTASHYGMLHFKLSLRNNTHKNIAQFSGKIKFAFSSPGKPSFSQALDMTYPSLVEAKKTIEYETATQYAEVVDVGKLMVGRSLLGEMGIDELDITWHTTKVRYVSGEELDFSDKEEEEESSEEESKSTENP